MPLKVTAGATTTAADWTHGLLLRGGPAVRLCECLRATSPQLVFPRSVILLLLLAKIARLLL